MQIPVIFILLKGGNKSLVETWIIVFLYSLKKKYNIKLIFKEWLFYPPLIMLGVYLIAEVMIFNDNYWITQYGTLIKQVTLFSYCGLVYKHQLYFSMDINKSELIRFITSPFIIAIGCLLIGYYCNFVAISSNFGHMPVFPSNTYFTGYTDVNTFTDSSFYVLGDHTSKAIPLCDIYDIYYSNLSLGDLFVRCYVFILLLNAIKRIKIKK